MRAEALDRVTDLSGAAQPEARIRHVQEAVSDAVEDGIARTKRRLQPGRRAAEDLVDEAEHHVKKHPLGTVGTAVGVGFC